MVEKLTSLVPEREQSGLFDEAELPEGLELLQPESEQKKRFTGEVVARNQGRYREIVNALGANVPVRAICRAFSVSHHVVKAIREREPDLVATEKKRVSQMLGHAARMTIESFTDDLESGKVPPSAKPVAAAIFLDKKALLDGEATSRIEHVSSGLPSIEEFSRLVQSLPVAVASELCSEGKGVETP